MPSTVKAIGISSQGVSVGLVSYHFIRRLCKVLLVKDYGLPDVNTILCSVAVLLCFTSAVLCASPVSMMVVCAVELTQLSAWHWLEELCSFLSSASQPG